MKGRRVSRKFIWFLVFAALVGVYQYKELLFTRAYPVFRSVEAYRLSNGLAAYQADFHGGFNIRYDSEDGQALLVLQKAIDTYAPKVYALFDYTPDRNLSIILFGQRSELTGRLHIPGDQSTMGAYYGGILNLLSPRAWKTGNQDIGMLDNVFVHELTHLVVDEFGKGNYPLWFTEGSALYAEYAVLGYEWGEELGGEHLYTMEDLTQRFSQLDEYLAYRESFVAVREMINRYGRDKYLSLLHALGQGMPFDTALQRFMGIRSQDIQDLLVPGT